MKSKRLTITVSVAVFIVVVAAIYLTVTSANYSRNAAKKDDNRIFLFACAYEVLLDHLSDENLLPQFETAEIVEEPLYGFGYLSKEDLHTLAGVLSEKYPYPITVSKGHDRLNDPTPYYTRNYILVYFSANYNDRTGVDRGFNTVKIEGFINNNEHPVAMFFRYRNNEWNLVKAESPEL